MHVLGIDRANLAALEVCHPHEVFGARKSPVDMHDAITHQSIQEDAAAA